MTNDIAVQGLIQRWQAEARAKRTRANELGDCRAGLELFTEATTLNRIYLPIRSKIREREIRDQEQARLAGRTLRDER
jgi:hypothetical protein